jgi:hypothetical protein
MKKIFYIAVVVTALVFATAGCDKGNEKEVASQGNQNIANSKASGGDWGIHRYWTGSECKTPADNCFDDIDVYSSYALFTEIGKYPNPKELPLVIREHISRVHLDAAINGKLKLSAQFDKKTNTLYLIFSETLLPKVAAVYPFTSK